MTNELREIVASRVRTGDRRVLQTVREWETAEGRFTAFYFRAEVCGGAAVPVYAVLGVPAGAGPFPGVLHFHGGGQTANPYLVEALVRHGYAAISFDWTGPREEREHVTRWNTAVRYSSVEPDAARIIRALTAGRQCLSILSEHPRVDATRLGEFGISWGGFQTWLLNAVDDRLKAAIAIYGCGITPAQARCYFQGEVAETGGVDAQRWFSLFHPAHYARCQHAPVLFVNGTNDFFGWMNNYRQLARKLDGRHRCAFAPHLNHAVGTLNPTLLAWLDHHLRDRAFPDAPRLEMERHSDGLRLRSPQLPGAHAATFYVAAETGVGPDLFWHPYAAECRGGEFHVAIPWADLPCRRLLGYIHQRWADGVELSSVPVRIDGAPAARVDAESAFPLAPEFWYGPAPTDPFYPYLPLGGGTTGPAREVTDSDLAYQFNTRLVAEARWRPARGQRFSCHLDGPVQDPVTVAVLKYAGSPREQRFQGEFSRAALAEGIRLDELKGAAGQGLRNGAGLSHLFLGGTATGPGVVRLLTAGWR
ncbi:MAG TPA: dienelactone hydrolase family protein [Armatimonadota bacterium]|jgi:dienelactone hydrolase